MAKLKTERLENTIYGLSLPTKDDPSTALFDREWLYELISYYKKIGTSRDSIVDDISFVINSPTFKFSTEEAESSFWRDLNAFIAN